MPIKPQILAAISGAISAYIADEEAAGQTAALTAMAAADLRGRRSASGPWRGVRRPCSSGC